MALPALRACVPILLVALLLAGPPAGAADPPDPTAPQVVVRGRRTLADALEAAAGPAWADPARPRPVLFVVDVSPNLAAAMAALRDAFGVLAGRARGVRSWSIAALGKRPSRPLPSAAVLYAALDGVLAEETDVPSTLTALDGSIASSGAREPVVVYLADWRFEDDVRLEAFIRGLRKREATLSVVGSEAAFGRAWNDGIKRLGDFPAGGLDLMARDEARYHPSIGRNPFGHGSAKAPWHGGDTAYPHAPYEWDATWWKTQFHLSDFAHLAPPGAGRGMGDLVDRLRRGEAPDFENLLRRVSGAGGGSGGGSATMRTFPLPSAFGAYGLMRAAGLTGGRYVLWSWNPAGRKTVDYDFGRCNLFPPDLRSRRAIRSDLGRNPFGRAMLEAWWALAEAGDALVRILPPLGQDLRTPRSIDLIDDPGEVALVWQRPSERDAFLKAAGRVLDQAERAAKILDRALAKGGDPAAGPMRRYQADALLLRYVVLEARFELSEAVAAARAVPDEAWEREGERPGVVGATWIPKGADPETLRPVAGVRPHDEEAGQRVLEARKRHLERFRRTPLGATVALNEVDTFRPVFLRTLEGLEPEAARSPTESGQPSEPTKPPPAAPTTPSRPPGPGSAGSGPTTR